MGDKGLLVEVGDIDTAVENEEVLKLGEGDSVRRVAVDLLASSRQFRAENEKIGERT